MVHLHTAIDVLLQQLGFLTLLNGEEPPATFLRLGNYLGASFLSATVSPVVSKLTDSSDVRTSPSSRDALSVLQWWSPTQVARAPMGTSLTIPRQCR